MFYSHSHMNTDTIRSRSCNELQREKTDAKMPEKTLQCLGTREQMFKLLRVSHSTLRFSVGGWVGVCLCVCACAWTAVCSCVLPQLGNA